MHVSSPLDRCGEKTSLQVNTTNCACNAASQMYLLAWVIDRTEGTLRQRGESS